MTTVYPISKHDAHLAAQLGRAIASLSNNPDHSAIIVHAPEAEDEANAFKAAIEGRFGSTSLVAMGHNPYGGWPMASNQMFAFAAKHIAVSGINQPWLWHEMDACPTRDGWADALTVAYQTSESPYLGVLKPTMFLFEDGRWEGDGSEYMSGVAIYPPDMWRTVEALKGVPRTNAPFDVFLRWEMKARGMKSTKLIAHRWRTSKWRWDGKMLVMENDEDGDVGIPREQPACIDPESVALIHGCVDGSLHEAIVEEDPSAVLDEVIPARRRGRPKKVEA